MRVKLLLGLLSNFIPLQSLIQLLGVQSIHTIASPLMFLDGIQFRFEGAIIFRSIPLFQAGQPHRPNPLHLLLSLQEVITQAKSPNNLEVSKRIHTRLKWVHLFVYLGKVSLLTYPSKPLYNTLSIILDHSNNLRLCIDLWSEIKLLSLLLKVICMKVR